MRWSRSFGSGPFLLVLLCAMGTTVAAARLERGCDDLYFGYGGDVDYAAAYACFDAARTSPDLLGALKPPDGLAPYAPMVLMRLNGDGVPRDLDVAAELLEEWQAARGAGSEQRMFLSRILLERRAGLAPDAGRRLVFCELPGGPSFRARCDEILRRREEGERERHVHRVRERVPEAARAELSGLIFSFGGYSDREATRVERGRVLDDDAVPAGRQQRARLQAHFDVALREAIVERTLSAASGVEASREERALERAYQSDREEQAAVFAAYESALPDSASVYERHRRGYDAAAQQSHAAWKRYRDAWVSVVRAAAPSDVVAQDAEAAIRRLLAEQRRRELRPEEPEG